jgi:plasmid maintenance system antidote protein VapI
MNLILKAKIVENYGTQADFAQVIGIDETIVSRVVRGAVWQKGTQRHYHA